VYARTNRPGKAVEVYERALKLAPHQEGLLLNLGLAYLKEEEYRRALPLFLEVKQIDLTNLQADELIATCRVFSNQDVNAAIGQLEQLQTTDPNKGVILYLLGVAYTRTKQPEKAKAVFEELLRSAVNASEAGLLMGRIYYDGGQFAQAEKALKEVYERDPEYQGIRLALAKVYISERENAKALELLKEIRVRRPEDAEAAYFEGALLTFENRWAEAFHALTIAARGNPDSWATHYYIAKAKLKSGEPKTALNHVQRAIELNASDPAVYYLLAQCLRATGREAEARTALERVRSLKQTALKSEQVIEREHIPGTR
jgi:tetratricopeptide (TPR) repeat protein